MSHPTLWRETHRVEAGDPIGFEPGEFQMGYAVEDGEGVGSPYCATGTDEGEILGVNATGTSGEVEGLFIFRLEEGWITECKDLWDPFGPRRQIRAVSMPLGD